MYGRVPVEVAGRAIERAVDGGETPAERWRDLETIDGVAWAGADLMVGFHADAV